MALLLRNVRCVVSCDENDTLYERVDIFCEDGVIKEIGKDLDVAAEKVINCSNMLCYPGLINTHHHMYQFFSRNLPKTQNMELFDWLTYLYDIWKNMDREVVSFSTKCALAELAKSGCTTSVDHHYVFLDSSSEFLDAQFEAADLLKMRLYATRGSMNLSRKDGGLPLDSVVQTTDEILRDSMNAIEKYNDNSFGSMRNIALAPCSPFSADADLYRQTAYLAREAGVRLHTHLCETKDEEHFTKTAFNMRPLEYMQSLDFIGEDVWYAHAIHLNDEELDLLKSTNTSVSHCPTSNMKLASGVARISDMVKRGINVSLGVDGSASNDGSNMICEIRNGYLLSRVINGKSSPDAYEFLKMATCGGAKAIGRDDIGSIAVGKCADMFLIDKRKIELVGATYSPKSMLASVGLNSSVDYTIVNGEIIVEEGHLKNIDEEELFYQSHKKTKEYLNFN